MKDLRVLAFPSVASPNKPTIASLPCIDELVAAFHAAPPTSRCAALTMLRRPDLAASFETLCFELGNVRD